MFQFYVLFCLMSDDNSLITSTFPSGFFTASFSNLYYTLCSVNFFLSFGNRAAAINFPFCVCAYQTKSVAYSQKLFLYTKILCYSCELHFHIQTTSIIYEKYLYERKKQQNSCESFYEEKRMMGSAMPTNNNIMKASI